MTQEIQKLEYKLEDLIGVQEIMKAVNSICRKKNLTDDEKVKLIVEQGLSDVNARTMLVPKGRANKVGFASYKLTNNNANIRATRERIERLTKSENTETKEYKGIDCEIEENHQENRIRLFFDGKPSEDIRTLLKKNGFKWSPSIGAWQNYINHSSMYFVKEHFLVK